MALTPGARLGPYEILSPLGAGGMDEVNRPIAIKVLPGAAVADAESRERLEHEAQVIAALNHPNIVTIHSVEETDGQFFLTMEFVEGRSLTVREPSRPHATSGLDVATADLTLLSVSV